MQKKSKPTLLMYGTDWKTCGRWPRISTTFRVYAGVLCTVSMVDQVCTGFSPRGVPPPLPSCPPPSTSHVDRMPELPISPYGYSQENYVAIDGGVCCLFSRKIIRPDVRDTVLSEGKKSSSLGKFLRNIGIRRSGRKNSYKQHSGSREQGVVGNYPMYWGFQRDLLASDITMSDEDRIALMVMVKEGKISTETALEVKRFEDDKRADEVKENRLVGYLVTMVTRLQTWGRNEPHEPQCWNMCV
ncbi:uncharacterized protein LOC124291439 isoform X2 [Haliotis rubra]|uniref:uncharacterized protein LOC124291439 isoform X2 n=1 Tax=Haliotis rubra TaxID=36100 RepID=UPI001EE5D72D|nr:uncharacterized protein LOC124291439 isoform X2 [Haliotis rubra]